jgi:glutathione synthase/RimK-type ligase-like ATP-grasp enzyme
VNPDVTILYDSIRWEEKALLEAGKKNNINIQMVDCKKLALNLEKKPEDYGVVIQRCVSYYRNLHSTAALEGLGVKVINCLNTGVFAGNKLFTHMLLKKFGVPTPDATVAFSNADMNLNPEAVDNFEVDAWSDSDAGGISLTVTETNEATEFSKELYSLQ